MTDTLPPSTLVKPESLPPISSANTPKNPAVTVVKFSQDDYARKYIRIRNVMSEGALLLVAAAVGYTVYTLADKGIKFLTRAPAKDGDQKPASSDGKKTEEKGVDRIPIIAAVIMAVLTFIFLNYPMYYYFKNY